MQFKNYIATLALVLAVSGLQAQTFFTETFAGTTLPAGWSNVEVIGNGAPTAVWLFGTDGPTGPFATATIASTTSGDGWATFDSDSNCNDPNGQDAWLISPAIDCSDKSAVWLQFETFYRSFNDRPQIRVGTDLNDLASWATFEVFPGITANDFGGILEGDAAINPQNISIDLSAEAVGESAVYVAFQFLSDATTANGGNLTGCGYAWQVDDMVLTETDPRPANDMRVNSFAAVAPNAVTPVSQVESIGFIADIANGGSATQDEVTLSMTITNLGGTEVFADQVIYTNLVPDTLAENVFFDNEYDVPATVEDYIATYALSYEGDDMDAVPENNSLEFIFSVSDTTFSKEIGATRSVAPAADESYEYGNVYYIVNGTDADGEPLYARTLTFGVANADELAGRSVAVVLYETTGDANEDFAINQDERELVAFNSYTFTGAEGQDLITIPMNDGDAVQLNEGSYYIATVQYSTDDDQACFLLASEDYDYAAMNFYTDSLDRVRYGAALDVSNEGDLSLVGFGLDIVPVVRLSIGGPDLVATKEVQLPAGAVSVFPNPADVYTNVSINLEEATNGTLKVLNTKGQILEQRSLNGIQTQNIELNTANLPAGTYLVRIETEAGVSSKMFTVQH